MDIALNTDFLTSRLSPEKYLRLTSEAGFTHLHWCHQWNTDYLYSASEIDQYKKWLKQYGLKLLDIHGSMGQEKLWYSTEEYQRKAGVELVLNRIIMLDELEGSVLAPYVTHRIAVELTPEEEAEYHAARKKYIDFIRAMRIDFHDKTAWGRFVALCFQNKGGRAVFDAFLRQREIARCGSGKLKILWRIILKYPGARIIVFTADNDTAYKIGELFCLPVITHKTKAAERKEFLESFRSGEYPVLVTSKVLNEGVDVPEANVGIVFSGSGSTREHIQRLGRILRRTADGKQAVLYELVSAGTSEMSVSERRRNNRAYQKMPVPGEK